MILELHISQFQTLVAIPLKCDISRSLMTAFRYSVITKHLHSDIRFLKVEQGIQYIIYKFDSERWLHA